jgi:RNA polymerase sigma-70 factor, ECF subfamily
MSASGAGGEFGALIEAVRDGSPEALASLYREYGAALYRLAYRLTGMREDAEDVVHDVFVGLPEALARYEERGKLTSWLKRVTARVALVRVRARTRRREVPLEFADRAPGPSAHTDTTALEVAVNRLPDPLRVVVLLKEVEGYSHREVADLLGISVGASRVRTARALARLRKVLEDGQ